MIGGSVTNGLLGAGNNASSSLLNTTLAAKPIEAHFSSKLSGSFPGAIEDLKLGTPFTLKPAPPFSLLSRSASPGAQDAKGAAKQMESYFIYMMMKEMWATLPEDGFLDSGLATDIFQQMWLEKVADKLATNGPGIGLAAVLEKAIAKQAATPPPPQSAQAIPLAVKPSFKPIPLTGQRSIAIRPPLPNQEIQVNTTFEPKPPAIETPPSGETRPAVAQIPRPADLYSSGQVPAPASAKVAGINSNVSPLPGTPVIEKRSEPAPPVATAKPEVQPKAPRPKPSSG